MRNHTWYKKRGGGLEYFLGFLFSFKIKAYSVLGRKNVSLSMDFSNLEVFGIF